MATITTINAGDGISPSRTVINTNFSNLNADKIETSVLDTDTTLAANSDAKIATQKAIKAYVDALAGLSTKTSGVSAGPASSSTQTISHGLGRVPTAIRFDGIGGFTANASATTRGESHGTYTSSGNRCLYAVGGGSSHNPVTSTAYAVRLDFNDAAATATGIVQNVTSTSFDIVWTTSLNAASNTAFIWEAN